MGNSQILSLPDKNVLLGRAKTMKLLMLNIQEDSELNNNCTGRVISKNIYVSRHHHHVTRILIAHEFPFGKFGDNPRPKPNPISEQLALAMRRASTNLTDTNEKAYLSDFIGCMRRYEYVY